MATVTGMTAAAMQAIKNSAIVNAVVDAAGVLTFTKADGSTYGPFNIKGPKGDQGAIGINWRGAWQPSTAYAVGDVVTNAGSTYRRNTAGTSGASFSATNWDVLAQAGTNGTNGNALSAYPVGSIFMGVTATNPATLLGGGTWVAWGAGRVPVGIDTTQTEFDTVEEIGGEKTHILTTAEAPAHTHGNSGDHDHVIGRKTAAGASNGVVRGNTSVEADGTTAGGGPHTHTSVGGGGAHNVLQPYITCYMWKRTA